MNNEKRTIKRCVTTNELKNQELSEQIIFEVEKERKENFQKLNSYWGAIW